MKSVIRSILAVILLALFVAAAPVTAAAAQTGQGPAAGGVIAVAPSAVLTSAAAASDNDTTAWTLDEPGISVNIPNYLYVLTRNIAEDDPTPAVFGLDRDSFIKYFKAHDIYLNAIASQVIYEINITMFTPLEAQKVWNLNTLTDAELNAFIQDSAPVFEINNYKYGTSEVYTGNSDAKFIKSDFEIGDKNSYGSQYFTIRDGKAINIILTSYSKDIVAQRTPMAEKIVDTLTFTKPAASAPQTSPSAALTSPSAAPGTDTSPSPSKAPVSGAPTSSGASPLTSGVPSANSQGNASNGKQGGLFQYIPYAIILFVTFVLLTVPMLIYRFAVLKSRLTRGKAFKVAGLYGLVFVVLAGAYIFFFKGSLLAGAGVVFWSIVNFFILSGGRGDGGEDEGSKGLYPMILSEAQTEKRLTETDSNPAVNKICKNCFAVNLATSKICFYCGAKLEEDEAVLEHPDELL